MDWEAPVLFHATALYQLAAFPFAILFQYLCTFRYLSIHARYTFLLIGGILLACAAMGCYALLIFISVFCTVTIICVASPQQVHKWVFFFQMTWQTLCHLGLQYKEYYLQEDACVGFSITVSALMLMTQKVTSLALDIHERKVRMGLPSDGRRSLWRHLLQALPFCAYLLSFPTLLGGPLCSFYRFQAWLKRTSSPSPASPLWTATQKALGALMVGFLKPIVRVCLCPQDDLFTCTHSGCIYVVWTSALLFRLTYYSHWMLDESLFLAAGLGLALGHGQYEGAADVLLDTDIWTLETTHRLAVFTRSWNKSTAQWLRRLIFQRSSFHPLLATFAFSAWWHGLYPGQVFGFLCWAVGVEADYRIHHFFSSTVKSPSQRLLYQTLTWCHTQLIMAYIMIAIEMRSLCMVCCLSSSYNSFFPLVYALSLLLLKKKERERREREK
ncbi:ghrelin O-acyltransferase [Hemicordylus capensis]|uniref:ghrelin O-acyltransferase n=1 Tax=Hemicordylus capensis TaxID=884348 RepID=UPI002302EF17|nr:ghrelin O-acyltransferase [Hemicordylus capensis]